jgi:hypothetical protein
MTESEVKQLIGYQEQNTKCGDCKFIEVDTDHERFYNHICNHEDAQRIEITPHAICNNYEPL